MEVVVKWVDEEGMRGEGLGGEKGAFLGWICRAGWRAFCSQIALAAKFSSRKPPFSTM